MSIAYCLVHATRQSQPCFHYGWGSAGQAVTSLSKKQTPSCATHNASHQHGEAQQHTGHTDTTYIHTYLHSCMHTYIDAYIPISYLPVNLHKHILTYTHTYTRQHTYIYTYIPTYLHTYIHIYEVHK